MAVTHREQPVWQAWCDQPGCHNSTPAYQSWELLHVIMREAGWTWEREPHGTQQDGSPLARAWCPDHAHGRKED